MRAAEENMLKALEDKKAKAALESMNKQMQEILGERPTGNKQYIAEDVLRRAQEKAMNAAEAQFKPEGVIQSKLEAGKTAVRMGEKKAGRAAALKMAGKALDAYNYGLILYDITVAFAEVTKGNSQAVDKGMGAFVDLGVSLVSTMAAAGAGAAAGAAWGASTGTAVGLAVGVVLGTMWGVANYICLKVTGKSLSEYLGGKINAAIDRYVAPAVQPLADDILRQQSGGLIDTRGFNPNNNFLGY